MKIKLNKLTIENIGGVKSFELDLSGKNAKIMAENGVGKTTVLVAFLWCLFGKNADGDSAFGLRPVDGDNNPIRGLVVASEIDLDIDGTNHIFRREHHENVVKKQMRGFTVKCTIDEVPYPITKYNDKIAEVVTDEVSFKLLTDLTYFCDDDKFHHTKRRSTLLDVAGEISVPTGFDDLLDALAGRTLEEYTKVLKDRIKANKAKHAEIVPRIDENQLKLDDYAENAVDSFKLEKQRHDIKGEIDALGLKRKLIIDGQVIRQGKIDNLNVLKDSLADRARFLKNDTEGVQGLIDEKVKIIQGVSEKQEAFTEAEKLAKAVETKISDGKTVLTAHMAKLDSARQAYISAKKAEIIMPPVIDGVCFNCNQSLPEEMKATQLEDRSKQIAKLNEERVVELRFLAAAARTLNEQLADFTAEADLLIVAQANALELADKASIELEEAEAYKLQRCTGIDEALAENKPILPDNDPESKILVEQIEVAEAEIGESTVDQLTEIDVKLATAREALEGIAKTLIDADNAKKIQPRIDKLKADEVDLAQKIADSEKELEDIKNYYKAECALIEAAVNGKFKHVKFRLFKELLKKNDDGEADTVPCCDALLNGVPYSDMSDGQKIYAGIDIRNVLSEHFGVSVPLFIDRAETFTMDREVNSQVIELHAVKGVTALTVEIE